MHLVLLCLALLLALAARVAKSDLFCGRPPVIKNAHLADEADEIQDEYKAGTEVVYTCRYGYVATGRSRIIRCDPVGDRVEWREPEFSCIPQSCGDPGHIVNGYRVGSLFTFPNNVTYHCDVGYILRGDENKERFCQTTGQWSGRLPICEVVTCDPPKDVPNGHVKATSYEYGATLTYGCDDGYRLSSNEDIYCTENGIWSKTDITCEEILCEMPEKPQFGYMIFRGGNGNPRAGTIVGFSCEEGRIPSGPTTSRCLEIGKWTFPAPKCLEPCTIQSIFNGVLGKYVRKWRSSPVFTELEVGTRVEEGEDLSIRCYEGFEVPGSEKQETRITCSKGRWSSELECNPASCRSNPPRSPNTKIVQLDNKHEGTVFYECFPDYRKTTEETVVCAYGRWNGEPAQCKLTKCSRDSITGAGILKGLKLFYSDGEVFSYSCDYPRYEKPAGHNGQIKCIDGTWTGDSPFCVAASCTTPPPTIANGKAKDSTMLHGAVAKYVCDYHYILISDSLVQCSYGTWTGKPPICRDSRCYLRNLSFKSNISPQTQTVTLSGYKLDVICEDGYSANTKLPVCEKGVWKENTYDTLCKDSDCKIPRIPHGSLKNRRMGNKYFNIYSFRIERKSYYETVYEGNSVPSTKVLFLFCEEPYSFQGTHENHATVAVQCFRGRWNTDPVCLRRGQTYIPTTTEKPRLSNPTTISLPLVTTSGGHDGPSETGSTKMFSLAAISSISPISTALVNEEVTDHPVIMDPTRENVDDQCSCYYPLDDNNVVAHANRQKLYLGDKVPVGVTVIFRCLYVGYHHLIGRTKITCNNCEQWHSSDFPSCNTPKKGNVVIAIDEDVKVLEDGTIEINKGQNINFTCLAVETANYPKWNVPDVDRIYFQSEYKEREEYNDILYLTHFSIQDADHRHEGTYYCFLDNNPNTIINITVIDPDIRCPEFLNNDNVIIAYEKNRQESSKAYFSCPNKSQELVGEPSSTCLRTKEWSAPLPYCTVRCKRLRENEHLTVQYTDNREVGSLATFHCFAPAVRAGESSAECLKNGSWSHPTPSCWDVRCKLLKETDFLAIVYSEDRKINSTATFHCFQPAKRSGVSSTKCLRNGSWADPIPTCKIPSCTADSLLSTLPHNAEPAIKIGKDDSFPVNTTVKLACTNGLVVNGNPLATCGKGSKWSYHKIECGSGCQPPIRHPDSTLKLNPERNVYKIGDQVTLSCPPGMKLDSELQVIACLMSGWSEKIVPRCIRDDKKEDYQTTQETIPETSFPY